MKKPTPDEIKVYEALIDSKGKYGTFHKACFHIHTPESHDYQLLADWSDSRYRTSSEKDIFDLCIQKEVFKHIIDINDITLDGERNCFKNRKEFFSFILLAETLISHNIELVLVTDHNTIDGIPKLETAIKELHKIKPRIFPKVISGIEVSCADKSHIVGIFESKDSNINKIKNWLNSNLLSVKEGSFRTGVDVLEFITSISGIGYIAHIDTSDIFKEQTLNVAYKKKLLSADIVKVVGLSNNENKKYISEKIRNYRSSNINFVLDNDSHEIDSIPKNLFWIKGQSPNFSMVKEALDDYDISVSFTEENSAKQYIKGIYIEYEEKGFLFGEENTAFCLTFSNALNCIIGGRGTGKSTILELLEYILSQRCDSEEKLNYLCSHGNSWVLYSYNGEEYLIEMRMPVKEHDKESILKYFTSNPSDQYHHKYHYNIDLIKDFAFSRYLKISKVIHKDNEWYLETVSNKKEMRNNFFDTRYSVNELVKTASSEEISVFIYNTLFSNKTLSQPEKIINFKKKSGLIRTMNDIKDVLEKRKSEVIPVITQFNDTQTSILRIVYTQDGNYLDPEFDEWLFHRKCFAKKWYKNYNITEERIIEYLQVLYGDLGMFEFLKVITNEDIDTAFSRVNLLDFCNIADYRLVEKGLSILDANKARGLTKEIFALLTTDDNIYLINDYLKKHVSGIERFSLEFNINNKAGNSSKPLYKPVRTLSLGQKVVAMLSFILGYSEYSNDFRPLIIDQPEDNLDSQYIYNNLVHQLRSIREKRQVIIATHNATIVTNAKAEQVCVMNSDNLHGWVERKGYTGNKKIKEEILRYLEGGKESFLHKSSIYQDVL